MFQTLRNAWKIPDIKKKLLFTVLILLLYRLGASIPVPFVSLEVYNGTANSLASAGIFTLLNTLSGGAISHATLFALSVSPYITASIVIQLLTVAIPALEKIAQSGEEGRKKITAYTRWVTVILAVVTAFGYAFLLSQYGWLKYNSLSEDGGMYVFEMFVVITCYCAGAALIMWLAEKINDFGIGNGISLILFANILSRGGNICGTLYTNFISGKTGVNLVLGILWILLILVICIVFVGVVVWFTNSERRIPVQYAKRVVGRKMYGGQNSNLPLKLNMTGVMPIIFSSTIVSILPTIAGFISDETNGFKKFVSTWLDYTSWVYVVLSFVLIIAFSYFYVLISFNPVEVANNIRNNGGSVPGIRPGKPTTEYITKVLNRVTLIGAIFLAVISCLPMVVSICIGGNSTLAFCGSSLLIVVGVAIETYREIESQITLRNYKGFLD